MVDRDVGGGLRVRIGGDNSGLRQSVDQSKSMLGELDQSARTTQAAFKVLGTVMAAAGAAMSVSKVIQYADGWSEMRARVANAKGEMESTDAIMRRLNDVASRTYSSLNQTAESWLRNSTALKELGYSTSQQLDLTESLNNALVISATRGQRAESVMNAWSNAMATGSLRGQNFNSVVQGSDRLAKALADSLGVSTIELRQMAADGKITTDVMFGVTSQLEQLREEADEMPATLDDMRVAWDKAFQVVIGTVDQATGASGELAMAGVEMARAFESHADTIATAFVAIQTAVQNAVNAVSSAFESMNIGIEQSEVLMIAAGGAATLLATALATSVVGAIKAVGIAIMANPIGILIAGLGAAVTAAYLFRDEIADAIGVDLIGEIENAVNQIVGTFVGAWKSIGETSSALWEAIVSSASSIPPGLEGIWETVKSGFFSMLSELMRRWDGFLRGLAEGLVGVPGMEDAIGALMSASGRASASWHGYTTAANQASAAATAAFSESSALMEAGVEGVTNAVGRIGEIMEESRSADYIEDLKNSVRELWSEAEEATGKFNDLNNSILGEGDDEGGGGGGGTGSGSGKKGETQEALNSRLERLRESLMSEEEALLASFEKQLAEIDEFYNRKMIALEEHQDLVERATIEHEEKLAEIRRQAAQVQQAQFAQMAGYITGTLQSISSMMDSEGDKQIGIQKAISLAIAGINVAEGITKALTLPFPMNLLAAAQTAAQGMAAIASINKANRGNSGMTTATAATPVTPAPMPSTMVIRGFDPSMLYSGEQVRSMAESLIEFQRNGGEVVWADQ